MTNTLETECLAQSFQNMIDTKVAHDRARDDFDGYSWGYHGYHDYIKPMEEAAKDFQDRLDAYIEKKIADALSKRG